MSLYLLESIEIIKFITKIYAKLTKKFNEMTAWQRHAIDQIYRFGLFAFNFGVPRWNIIDDVN